MLTVHEKRILKKMIYSKITLLILFVIVVLFARGTWKMWTKATYARENKDKAQAELASLEERKEFLEKRLEFIKTKRGREAEIRSQFDVGRVGEKMIVLVDTPEQVDKSFEEEPSIWEKIKRFFTAN